MPSVNWFNENSHRAFPFRKRTVGVDTPATGAVTMRQLPSEWIVDLGFTLGTEIEFREDLHHIYLQRVYRNHDQVFFTFESDCPDLAGEHLTFMFDLDGSEYVTSYVDGDAASGDCEVPHWSGYMVSGNLASVVERLDQVLDQETGDQIVRTTGDALVETALVRPLSYLLDINLANTDRTRATSPDGCPALTWPHETGIVFVNARCLQGDLRWRPGYNCGITQNTTEGSLTIIAREDSVEGPPCVEVPLFAEESPPDGATNELFSGGPLCNETLRSINGLGGPLLTLKAGTGVSIVPDPDNHRVAVDVNMLGLAVCFDSISYISESV